MARRGKFIVIEGIDGCGKSTQIDCLKPLLEANYNGNIHYTAEATDMPIGKILRERYLSGSRDVPAKIINLLYVADRYEHIHHRRAGILKMLNDGIDVICDRFYYSSFVYDTYMDFGLDEFDEPTDEWAASLQDIIQMNEQFLNELVPDLVIFIATPPGIAMERISKGREDQSIYEDLTKLDKLSSCYQSVMQMFDKSKHNDDQSLILNAWKTKIVKVDGSMDPDSVCAEIYRPIIKCLNPKLVLNPDRKTAQRVLEQIQKNDGYCIKQPDINDRNIKCPCDSFYHGKCYCQLFVEEE